MTMLMAMRRLKVSVFNEKKAMISVHVGFRMLHALQMCFFVFYDTHYLTPT